MNDLREASAYKPYAAMTSDQLLAWAAYYRGRLHGSVARSSVADLILRQIHEIEACLTALQKVA
jgi:hypothetical protein